MKLWTFHTSDFSLTSGKIEIGRSPYIDTIPNLREAYEELAHRLGLKSYEILWCHVRQDWTEGYADCVEWELEVPDEKILDIVDSYIWNKILRIMDVYPRSLYKKWRDEAPPYAMDDYINQKIQVFNEQQPPADGWWSQLSTDLDAGGDCTLLKHPIPDSWII